MKVPKRRYNPKRKITRALAEADRQRLIAGVRYGGNPEHKRNPGDFRLTPRSSPRKDKSLCDVVEVFERQCALQLLRRGIERGMVSDVPQDGWPQNIWSMTDQGQPLEAQLENPGLGTYHGYPLPESDPFANLVRKAWDREGEE